MFKPKLTKNNLPHTTNKNLQKSHPTWPWQKSKIISCPMYSLIKISKIKIYSIHGPKQNCIIFHPKHNFSPKMHKYFTHYTFLQQKCINNSCSYVFWQNPRWISLTTCSIEWKFTIFFPSILNKNPQIFHIPITF